MTPCSRMPITVGNVRKEKLLDVYAGNEMLRRLRDPSAVPEECGDCPSVKACGGGLRCLAYVAHGDPFRADPGCWIARRA